MDGGDTCDSRKPFDVGGVDRCGHERQVFEAAVDGNSGCRHVAFQRGTGRGDALTAGGEGTGARFRRRRGLGALHGACRLGRFGHRHGDDDAGRSFALGDGADFRKRRRIDGGQRRRR
jgi:hypothetical protein